MITIHAYMNDTKKYITKSINSQTTEIYLHSYSTYFHSYTKSIEIVRKRKDLKRLIRAVLEISSLPLHTCS